MSSAVFLWINNCLNNKNLNCPQKIASKYICSNYWTKNALWHMPYCSWIKWLMDLQYRFLSFQVYRFLIALLQHFTGAMSAGTISGSVFCPRRLWYSDCRGWDKTTYQRIMALAPKQCRIWLNWNKAMPLI